MKKEVSRRDALKLAAGAAALGAALGVPRSALAMAARGEMATDMFFKFYYAGKLWHSIQLTEEQQRQLGANPGALSIKLFRSGAEQIGSLALAPEIQIKLRSMIKGAR